MVDRTSVVTAENPDIAAERLRRAFAASPRLTRLRERLGGHRAHLVGGSVRDLLLARDPGELDVAIEGDAIAVALAIDPRARTYKRYGTATVSLDGERLDLAGTRTETYAHDGALPVVAPASIDDDLRRRDFSVNAMALSLAEMHLRDPLHGLADLEARVLRTLHERSLRDDPTRALRAARYAARLGFEPEPATLQQIRSAPLDAISSERVEAELRRAATEPEPAAVLERLVAWGIAEPVLARARELLAAGRD